MKTKIYSLNLFLAILISSNALAQRVINYSTANINSDPCNVFNAQPQTMMFSVGCYLIQGK